MIPVATFLLYALFASLLAGGPVTARGVVLDGEGLPVAGAEVRLERSPRDGVLTGQEMNDPVEGHEIRSVTGPDGSFEIAVLPEQVFDLEIRGTGHAPLSRLGIRIPAGRTTADIGSFRLQPGATVVGLVTDPRGRPISGAAVWRDDSEEEAPVAESGPDGRFVLRDLDPQDSLELAVCRPGFLSGSFLVEASAPEVARMVLEPAARIAGRVLDPQGSPVAGAEIQAYYRGEDRGDYSVMYSSGCPAGHAGVETSDTQGRFRLESLLPGPFGLTVTATGYPASSSEAAASPSGPELTVRLEPGAVLAGRVLDTDGRPVSSVRISVDPIQPALSGPDGAYRLPGVAPGVTRVQLFHPDHALLTRTLRIEPGENRFDAKLSRTPRHPVSGRVLDPQGQPLAGARVLLVEAQSSVATAADGSFVLQLEEGSHLLESQAASYAPARQEIQVAGGPVEGVELRLSPGITLSGRLLAGGEDLSGATVYAIHRESSLIWTTTVDASGRYRLQGLFPGTWFVTGSTSTRQEEEEIVLAPGEEERVFDLLLADVFEVRGRVTGPEGEPVHRAMVRFAGAEDGAITPTDADGSFSVHLREGAYQSQAEGHAAGYTAAAGPSFELRGGPVEGIDIQLPKGITLRGQISGRPADNEDLYVEVTEAHSGQGRRFAEVTREGGYRLPGLPPGEWEVTARQGLATVTGRVLLAPGMDEAVLDLTLVPGSLTLSGRILAEDLSFFDIFLETADRRPAVAARANEKGEFRLERIPPGTYFLSIFGNTYENPQTFQIEMSSDREILVNLQSGAVNEP